MTASELVAELTCRALRRERDSQLELLEIRKARLAANPTRETKVLANRAAQRVAAARSRLRQKGCAC